jgi:hypothetical protein
LTHFTRYRGLDAELLIHALEIQSQFETAPADVDALAPQQVEKTTVHDVKIP